MNDPTVPPPAFKKPLGPRPPRGDSHGVVVVDKPTGPSSHDVVGVLRKAFNTRAVGHCGTLDPEASGVLVCLLGRYTRLSPYLTSDDKRYRATVCFGQSTSTDDREGEVTSTADAAALDAAALKAVLPQFVGPLLQVPPMFSALSRGGERLYDKARKGTLSPEDLAPRAVVVHALEVVSFAAGATATAVVDIACGKGFYVRSLARDLGVALRLPSHLAGLVRTGSGAYALSDAVPLPTLVDDPLPHLRQGAAAVRGMPHVSLDAAQVHELQMGRLAAVDFPDAAVALGHQDGAPVAVVSVEGGQAKVLRGFGGG